MVEFYKEDWVEFSREDCERCWYRQTLCEYHRGFQDGWDMASGVMSTPEPAEVG